MIAPILKYPGAKWRLASWLHQHAPQMPRVVEPYCGSAAFALTLPYEPRQLVLNDQDDQIGMLFRAIRNHESALCRAVALTPWSRAEYEAVTTQDARIIVTGDEVEDARRYLVLSWMQHGTKYDRRGGWRHQGSEGRSSTYQLWASLPDRLAAVAAQLKRAEIECLPALTIIGYYATTDTLLYVDPPYLLSTRSGGRMYRHEMTDADHVALLDALDAHPGPVLLSGYQSALYDERLTAWRRVDTITQAEKGNERVESLWLNAACQERLGYGPLFAEVAL
jgi:DNA adenine methylase